MVLIVIGFIVLLLIWHFAKKSSLHPLRSLLFVGAIGATIVFILGAGLMAALWMAGG